MPTAVVDGVAVADQPGVFVAGDWITTDGLLADAALSSGRAAGLAAAEFAQEAVLPALRRSP